MATPSTPKPLTDDAQAAVINYLTAATSLYNGSFNIRNQLLTQDRAYYREQDGTREQWRARVANDTGDATKVQNITVPVVMPQVESALAYLSDTFLTGYPIFGVVSPPEFADALGAMETLIGENSIRAGWPMHLMQCLRNGLKHDLGAVEVVWETRKTFNIGTPELNKLEQGKVNETQYQGNFIKNLTPYNLILDTRVSPDKNHIEGEYAGYTEMLSRIEAKKRADDLDPLGTMNFRKAWESGTPGPASSNSPVGNFYLPEINPSALLQPSQTQEFNWMNWAGITPTAGKTPIAYRNAYEWTVLYARILPSDFGMTGKDRNHVQIWKFIIINRSVVIFAERQTNAHNYLPIVVCKPSNDGMGWQSKSFGENVIPIQQISSALTNSALASQKKKVYDRILYDPTRIRKQDIDNTSPVARIPVKNSGFGKSISDAIYAVPYRDDGVGDILQISQQIVGMGEIVNGQNRVQQGQFQKGNKTRTEFETVMSNSNSRQKMTAIALEYSFFTPIKEIIKANILQYQPPVTIMNSESKKAVKVDPEMLRKAMISFTLSDGLLPSDKLLDTGMFTTMLQTAQAMPAMQADYDFMGMFNYMMAIRGAHWVKDFKRSEADKAAYMAQMQAAAQASGDKDVPEPQPPDPGATGAAR